MLPTHIEQVRTVTAQFPQVVDLLHGVLVVEEAVMAVPLVDDATPACPSPDAEDGGEEIVVGHVGCDFIAVEACNHADALIVGVTVEQFFAEGKEGLGRHVIVFEHDAAVGDGECPFLGEVFGGVAPVVLLLVKLVHLAFPVDVGYDLTALQDAFHVLRPARSVLVEEEAGRTCFLDFVEDFLEEVGTVEEEDEDGDVYVGRVHVS